MKKHTKIFLSTPTYPEEFLKFRLKLASVLGAYGFETLLIEREMRVGDFISDKVSAILQKSDLIIVDITKDSPFIAFEMGFASALSIPVIVIINEKKMPNMIPGFYIEKYPILTYKEDNLTLLGKKIHSIILASSKSGD